MIISPFSTVMALALLCQATEGSSFEELRNVMHLNGTKAAIVEQFHQYYNLVQKSAGQSELIIANQVFIMDGYQLRADLQEIAVNKLYSGVESVNFANATETAQTINQFVKEKTKKKIKEAVKPGMFGHLDPVSLVNAIYLKSKWVHPFRYTDRRNSKIILDFFSNETSLVRVEYVTVKEKFWHTFLYDLKAAAVRLDYVNSNFSFVIILPHSASGLSALEAQLNNYDMSRITDQMKFIKGDIGIPKFKVHTAFSLNEILKKMGVVSVFDHGAANLSGLSNSTEQLNVANVFHNVIIEINDEHADANASTGCILGIYLAEKSSDLPCISCIRMDNYFEESNLGRKLFLFRQTSVHVLYLGPNERDYNFQRSNYKYSYELFSSLEKCLQIFINNSETVNSVD